MKGLVGKESILGAAGVLFAGVFFFTGVFVDLEDEGNFGPLVFLVDVVFAGVMSFNS